ncbi:hypothetical protein C2845_PM12G19620 [Panicum miliaceum]|uniref:Uncharacterized protein n=1 Tax=Panicum miliaceum TaxID=4540 RepID=A0A3L6QFM0_PANMI|nr:hypothetical protein C2845_PM12G19620 [Panicum miliaceum]
MESTTSTSRSMKTEEQPAFPPTAIATVDGHRVALIRGREDVLSMFTNEGRYNNVFHLAVARLCLNDTSYVVNWLARHPLPADCRAHRGHQRHPWPLPAGTSWTPRHLRPRPRGLQGSGSAAGALLDDIDALLATEIDYPDTPPDSFSPRVVAQLQEELEDCRQIRGLDHLLLFLDMPSFGPGYGFCVSQLYLGNTEIMLKKLEAAQEAPHYYMFGNMDLVKKASGLRSTLVATAQHLHTIADGRKASAFDLPVPPDGAEHAGLVSALTTLVNTAMVSVEACWGISIEYADNSMEVFVPKGRAGIFN